MYAFEELVPTDVDEDDEGDEEEYLGRCSVRKLFCANALAPLLGYADTFEKVQFVYDLLLWTEIGAKRNMAKAPMRIMMA